MPAVSGPIQPPEPGGSRRLSSSQRHRDAGVSEVIGSVLMVAITVIVAAGLVLVLLAVKPGASDTVHANLALSISNPDGIWSSGDERVVLTHQGGEAMGLKITRIYLSIDATDTLYMAGGSNELDHAEQSAFNAANGDVLWSIGESWQTPAQTLNPGERVAANVVSTAQDGSLVWSSQARVANIDCTGETTPPTVSSWSQTPSDLDTSHTGVVTVTVKVTDGCSGVDEAIDPDLHYRINDGSDPAYTTLGPMTRIGTERWEATIPEPAGGWTEHALETLQYYADGMTDQEGNVRSGVNSLQSDTIELVGTTTYVATFTATEGTVTDPDNAKAEDGTVATLTEEDVSSGTVSETTALSANGVEATGAFTGGSNGFASDDVYATATASSGGASTLTPIRYALTDQGGSPGPITKVELKAEVQADSTNSAWRFQACISTSCTTQSNNLGSPTSDTVLTYDITALNPTNPGGSWSWTSVDALSFEIQASKPSNGGAVTFNIDHAWVEVTYDAPAPASYSLDVQANIEAVPAGTARTLELGYAVTGDTYTVQVWDATNGAWATRGGALTATSQTPWSILLTDDEYDDAADRVMVRFLDATGGSVQGTLLLDYVRVVTA